jgi:septal ring factor EnvC (AmiA/AmiB activator)
MKNNQLVMFVRLFHSFRDNETSLRKRSPKQYKGSFYKILISPALIIIISLLSVCHITVSQDVDKLRKEREFLLKEIENIQKQLNTKQTTREEALKQIDLLTNEISIRENLIKNFKQETEALNYNIETKQLQINTLEKNINDIKSDYIKLLQDAYLRHNSNNELLFLLSSKDFSEAYKKHRLLKEYSNYRKNQGMELVENQNKLKVLMIEIKEQRDEKEKNLTRLEKENLSLNRTQSQKQNLIEEIKKDEKTLKQTLLEKEKQAKALENKIMEYVRQSKNSKSEYGKEFKDNKGKLNWPISKGIIISEFGEHEHPVIKGLVIKNNGIDIQSSGSEDVVTVFTGEVSRVFSIPGYNNAIIIRHGDYLTVYANLKEIYVKQGQKIQSNEKIGTLYKESKDAKGVLHFEIWKENQKLNPSQWLKMQ